MKKIFVILYNPGAGGDMVASLIDKTDYVFDENFMHVTVPSLRRDLIEAHFISNNVNDINNTQYDTSLVWRKLSIALEQIKKENRYKALSSHDFAFFFSLKNEYDLIIIDDFDNQVNEWTLQRANKKAPTVHLINDGILTERISRKRYMSSFKVINMRDIMNGNLLNILKQWVDGPLNEEIYHTWLKEQDKDSFPF